MREHHHSCYLKGKKIEAILMQIVQRIHRVRALLDIWCNQPPGTCSYQTVGAEIAHHEVQNLRLHAIFKLYFFIVLKIACSSLNELWPSRMKNAKTERIRQSPILLYTWRKEPVPLNYHHLSLIYILLVNLQTVIVVKLEVKFSPKTNAYKPSRMPKPT